MAVIASISSLVPSGGRGVRGCDGTLYGLQRIMFLKMLDSEMLLVKLRKKVLSLRDMERDVSHSA